jgi:hypothetical protein
MNDLLKTLQDEHKILMALADLCGDMEAALSGKPICKKNCPDSLNREGDQKHGTESGQA